MFTAVGRASARVLAGGSALALRRTTTALPIRLATLIDGAPRTFATSQQLADKASAAEGKASKPREATATKVKGSKATATKKPKKKKKAAAKPKPKKKKKVQTPEEKLRADIRALRAAALLDEPKRLAESAWTTFFSQRAHPPSEGLSEYMKDLASQYRNLSHYEKQELEELAGKNKLENNATYKAWVERHTPLEIHEANKARAQLRRKLKASSMKYKPRPNIRDERQPKRQQTSFGLFSKARWAEGGLPRTVVEASRQITEEWANLSSTEKKVYEDLAQADLDRYEREMQSVLGIKVTRSRTPSE